MPRFTASGRLPVSAKKKTFGSLAFKADVGGNCLGEGVSGRKPMNNNLDSLVYKTDAKMNTGALHTRGTTDPTHGWHSPASPAPSYLELHVQWPSDGTQLSSAAFERSLLFGHFVGMHCSVHAGHGSSTTASQFPITHPGPVPISFDCADFEPGFW